MVVTVHPDSPQQAAVYTAGLRFAERDPKVVELREWLGPLRGYLPTLLEKGFDCVEVFRPLEEAWLPEVFDLVGMHAPGHQDLLRRKVYQLQTQWQKQVSGRKKKLRFGESIERHRNMAKSRFSSERRIKGMSRFVSDSSANPFRKAWAHVQYYTNKRLLVLAMLLRQIYLRDLVYVALVVFATFLLRIWHLEVDLNPYLYLIVVVFPLAFSVNSAFLRREAALRHLASLKANTLMLWRLHVDWAPRHEPPPERLATFVVFLEQSLVYFASLQEEDKEEALKQVLSSFAAMSRWNAEMWGGQGLAPAGGGGGVAPPLVGRGMDILRMVMCSFEHVRVIADYRTPVAIRAYIKFSVLVLNFLISPYYAFLGNIKGYWAAAATTLLFRCLLNTQKALEHPFGDYPDSINIDYVVNEFEIAATTPLYFTSGD